MKWTRDRKTRRDTRRKHEGNTEDRRFSAMSEYNTHKCIRVSLRETMRPATCSQEAQQQLNATAGTKRTPNTLCRGKQSNNVSNQKTSRQRSLR